MVNGKLVIYGHPISQPTRAVLWACKLTNTPFEFQYTDVAKGASRTPGFLAKFAGGTVPAMDDDGFLLFESNAILTYLATKHMWSSLYPQDAHTRARIDQYLHWHHGNTRSASTGLFRVAMIANMKGEEMSPKHLAKATKHVDKWMAVLDQWLSQRKFIATVQYPTLADIAAFCEIDQLVALQLYDVAKWKNVERWVQVMAQLPEHGVRKTLNKFAVKVFKLPQPKF